MKIISICLIFLVLATSVYARQYLEVNEYKDEIKIRGNIEGIHFKIELPKQNIEKCNSFSGFEDFKTKYMKLLYLTWNMKYDPISVTTTTTTTKKPPTTTTSIIISPTTTTTTIKKG